MYTATAVAGVLGSALDVETDGQETNVGCLEGEAYTRGIDRSGALMKKVLIKKDLRTRILKHATPSRPTAIP
ncbi:hypothetical protein ACFL0T_04585, partial [Candidatus Omnitrophota bacterium]